MIKKSVFFVILSLLAVIVLPVAAPALAQDMTLSGTINDASGCRVDGGDWYVYDEVSFTPTVTGKYTISYVSHTWSGDYYPFIFQAPYDPTVDPDAQNYLGQAYPTLTLELIAGVTYVLAIDNDQEFDTQGGCLDRGRTDSGTYTFTVTLSASCPESISLPPDAAVGTFTAWADLYWMPGEKVNPPLSMAPGQSLWVIGQDETGMYKKVVLSCQYLWVESAVIGPNYDETWHGTPLPTTVVDQR